MSLAWDNHGDLRSPLKDTSDLLDTSFRFEEDLDSLPPALSRDRSDSVSVNKAKYLTLEEPASQKVRNIEFDYRRGRNFYYRRGRNQLEYRGRRNK